VEINMRIAPWLLIGAMTLPAPAVSQVAGAPSWSPTRVVVSGGLGTGTRDIALKLAASVGGPRREVILRWAAVTDFELFAPATLTRDVAVLVAFRDEHARSWYRGAVGIGHVRSSTDGCYPECPGGSGVGLAFQADAAWAPARAFGLGAQLFGNMNTVDTFLGIALNLHLGTMR
jgi:hypothetical protein